MATIVPHEIYLLETYSSVGFLAQLRDTWGDMVRHLEDCRDQFMLNLPADYRNRPLPAQPDAVWGQHVLPNFRSTYDALCAGVIALSHGDQDGLYSAEHSIPAYMAAGMPAAKATVIVGMEDLLDENGAKYGEQTGTDAQLCLWSLIERDASATAKRAPPHGTCLDR